MTAVLPRARVLRAGAALALLAAPTILAFADGGFFAEATLVAGLVAWIGVAVLALSPLPLPAARPTSVSAGALAALTTWTALSIAWSPLKDQALRDAERAALYLALFLGGVLVFRDRGLRRFVEPLLALGVTIVACYALSSRLLPGIVESAAAPAAGARLWQPLTYWNALGLLMAFGVALAVRVAADRTWHVAVRVAASATGPLLLLALYLTLSRGATVALLVSAIVLVLASRERRAVVDAAAVVGVCGGALIAVASRFDAVDSLAGDDGDLRRQGVIVLALALAAAGAAALGAVGLVRLERGHTTWTAWLARRRPIAVGGTAAAVLAVGAAIAFAPGSETDAEPVGAGNAGPGRFRTLESDRYAYWRVAFDELTEQPLRGLGSGAFAAVWRQERDRGGRAQDAHSLYLETALELGLIGLVILLVFMAGAGLLVLRHATAYPGLAALAATWAVHAAWDWDWQMPAVTAPALIAVAVCAAAEEDAPAS